MHELLEPDVAARVIFDLGLVRNIGYYTGAVFEVYDPALGAPIGGGGRYDELLGRFGQALPAVGFALGVDRLHIALAGEERGTGALLAGGDGSGGLATSQRGRQPRARSSGPMSPTNGLTIAVPRGALFAGTVDLLAALGLDTEELRSNDRKLLFEDIGVITMRPSDVPTYVEAGAADLGVTGKDVLLEQAAQRPGEGGREVYELLDLGYGRCTMVLASKAGPDPALEALRRLGVMRVATKYPRIAARHMEETGRQAEIVEVKGSVELAPLTGMVEAIVDLTATGTTLRENNLIVREEIVECTARLIANPVAHKLKAAPHRRAARPAAQPPGRDRRRLRCASSASTPLRLRASAARPRAAEHLRALVPDGASVQEEVREIIERVRGRGRRGRARLHAPVRHRRRRAARAAGLRRGARRGDRCAAPRARRRPAGRDRERRARLPRRASASEPRSSFRRASGSLLREVPVASAAVYVPGGRAPYPSTVVMGVVTARSAGVIDVAVCAPPGPDGPDRRGDPRHMPAVRRRARISHGRRPGDRRAGPRHRDGRSAST